MQRIKTCIALAALAAYGLGMAGTGMAADLTVPAGQTYVVGPAQSDLRLEHLTLGDNARVTFAPGITSWRVYAKHASVGQNVVIDGRGADGGAGTAGAERSGRAKACEAGRGGGNGGVGGDGGRGVDMVLWWGVDAIGSLAINADGGNGGAGGNGGRGQEAGAVNRCAGESGGAGGNGGSGGAGGKGGDIALTYAGLSGGDKIRISSRGGQPGAGGAGGTGGTADEGAFQRTATGDRWFAGGQPGGSGSAGTNGRAGAQGGVQLAAATDKAGPAWREELGSAPTPTVAALQQQVQALQASAAVAAPAHQAQPIQDLIKQMQARIDDLEQRVQFLEKR